MKLSEQEWLERNSARFGDDQQACYSAMFHAWRYGEIDSPMPSADMLDAWEADAISFRKSFDIELQPF
jgi:hypothetical protein